VRLRFEPNRQRNIEEQHIGADFLRLLNTDFRQFGFFVPGIRDVQLRMTGVINVLIEELVEGAARKLFKHCFQVFRGNIAIFMPLQVRLDGAPVEVLAHFRPQHVQNPASFGICQVIELLLRRLEIAPHNRIRLIGVDENSFGAVIHAIEEIIAPMLLIFVKFFVVSRETFVEPDVRPIFARDQIAEPLMRQLMRDQSLTVMQIFE